MASKVDVAVSAKRNKRARGKKKPAKSRSGTARRPDRLARSAYEIPYLAGDLRQDDVQQVLSSFDAYERWVQRGRREDEFDPALFPPEYLNLSLLREDDETMEFFRHSYFALLDRSIVLGRTRAVVIRGMLDRAAALRPQSFEALCNELKGQDPTHAVGQMRNASRRFETVKATSDDEARLEQLLAWYSTFYEIDVLLWFLGCVGRIVITGEFDPSRYGGPTTSAAQGNLANEVMKDVEGTPLLDTVRDAYDRELRNAIAHNDYRIARDGSSLSVECVSSGRSWTDQEIRNTTDIAMALVQGGYYGLSYARFIAPAVGRGGYRDRGIIAALYRVDDGLPCVLLMQLWCFWELDPTGQWIDGLSLQISNLPDGTPHVFLTDDTCTAGEIPENFLAAVTEGGWIQITRIPIAPAIHKGVPIITTPYGQRYEVPGAPDVHLVTCSVTDVTAQRNCFHSLWAAMLGIDEWT